MYPTAQLAKSPLYQRRSEGLTPDERIRLSYERAQSVGRIYGLTAHDVLTLSPRFWKLHTDPIFALDGAAMTLNTLQYNCCAGTLAMFSRNQPDLVPILQQVLNFDVSGQYLLTEVGHGLDAIHLETTATLLPNGEFELNTPTESAVKFMPPTTPMGIPCVAVVFARAIVEGNDHGIKPFIVHLHDGKNMEPGIVSKLIPPRGGSRPVNHSITSFHRVRLQYSALLGPLAKAKDPRTAFFHNISRVAVGSIAIASFSIPVLRVATFIAGHYSLRRTVVDHQEENSKRPIISFRTQKIPITTALAQSFVLPAFHEEATSIFRDVSLDSRVRHAIASIFKVTTVQHTLSSTLILGDRCGAQGLFEANQITAMNADIRGASIAEGDLLALSIRFASELLLGRYTIPGSTNPDSLLARRESGMFDELRRSLASMKHHRSSGFDRLILPECTNLIQAIGHRMAYDAAIARSVDPVLIDLYVASCVKLDSAWYVEKAVLSRYEQCEMENRAVDAVFDRMEEFLAKLEVDAYVTAPIISDKEWSRYVEGMKTFRRDEAAVVGHARAIGTLHPADTYINGSQAQFRSRL